MSEIYILGGGGQLILFVFYPQTPLGRRGIIVVWVAGHMCSIRQHLLNCLYHVLEEGRCFIGVLILVQSEQIFY